MHWDKPILVDGLTKLNCTKCEDFFFSKIELDRHLNLVHEAQTKLNFCKKCKQSYTDKHNFCPKEHTYPSKNRKVLCNKCGKYLATKQHFDQHVR